MQTYFPIFPLIVVWLPTVAKYFQVVLMFWGWGHAGHNKIELFMYCLFDLNEMFDLLHTFITNITMLMEIFSISNQ